MQLPTINADTLRSYGKQYFRYWLVVLLKFGICHSIIKCWKIQARKLADTTLAQSGCKTSSGWPNLRRVNSKSVEGESPRQYPAQLCVRLEGQNVIQWLFYKFVDAYSTRALLWTLLAAMVFVLAHVFPMVTSSSSEDLRQGITIYLVDVTRDQKRVRNVKT